MAKRTVSASPATRERLSRDRILEAALALIDRDGLDALSMRRLGAECGVEAMSLYNHFPNKDELLKGVTGVILREIELPDLRRQSWVEALRSGFHSYRRVLLSHPNVIPLMTVKPDVSPESFRPIEFAMEILRTAGFDPVTALHAHWLLVGFTMGHVSFQAASTFADPDAAVLEIEERKRVLSEDEFPRLYEVFPYLAECDFDSAFHFGLDVLLEGLAARLR
ncbi:MAG: TetR/AcrR family transcriptional regulator C-terminal domain-containing protein [Actinomycetota bacterium]|nr:TetR/AcrR family transcriptional regulator C-terminal domain-containing protein [Actinomycetota bacterium]